MREVLSRGDQQDVIKENTKCEKADIQLKMKDDSYGNDDDDDTLEEDFLLEAISAVQENSADEEDGIDDIDIDFDEGDSNALIHGNQDDHQNNKESLLPDDQNDTQCQLGSEENEIHALPLEVDIIKDEPIDETKEITVEISNPRSCSIEESRRSTKHTIHYKPQAINIHSNKPKETLSDLKARHDFMCSCDSCQVLYDTYKEFVDVKSKSGEGLFGPPAAKKPREQELKEGPAIAHMCNTCNTILSSYKEYRVHLQEKHPRHWKTIQEFEEKRKSVVRKTSSKHIPSHGSFFKKELQRVVTSQPVTPIVNVPQKSPVAYFYPMVYPVYFVSDNNNKPVPTLGPPQNHYQQGNPVVQTSTAPTTQLPNFFDPNKHEPFVCGNCGLTFRYKEHLVLHMRIHNEKPFKCDSCGVSFVNNVELKRHYRTHTFSKKCEHCNESFVSHGHLREHVNLVHANNNNNDIASAENEPPRRCPICDLDINTRELWEKHMMTHSHSGDVFLCTHCGLSFADNDALQQHLKTHSKLQVDLKEQLQLGNGTHDKLYFKCDLCSFSCTTAAGYYRHNKRDHANEKTYECGECGAQFKTNSQRKAHFLTHTGERPFKCNLCSATFIQQGNLKRHIWTHTGEKPHVCDICGAGFLSTSDLKRHTRTHTGERPYKCHLCTYCFTTSGNLKSHLKTHLEQSSLQSESEHEDHMINIKEEPIDYDDDALQTNLNEVRVKIEEEEC